MYEPKVICLRIFVQRLCWRKLLVHRDGTPALPSGVCVCARRRDPCEHGSLVSVESTSVISALSLQCSVTCGEGTEVRQVLCRAGDHCDGDKPESVRPCQLPPCNGEFVTNRACRYDAAKP